MKIISPLAFGFLLSATAVQGAVVVSTDNQVGPGGAGSTFTPTYNVSASDLINGLAPSAFAGDFAAVELSGGTPVLTNGMFGTITEPGGAPDRTHFIFGLGGGGAGTGIFVTYTLDTSVNTRGYDITSIAVYGGWNDNGRDQQAYTAAYSLVGSPAFIDLPPVNFNPAVNAGFQSATRTVISENALAALASGVDEIRFTFNTPPPENGYTGYAELDVFGSPTPVPEPGSVGLMLGGLTVLIARRKRR